MIQILTRDERTVLIPLEKIQRVELIKECDGTLIIDDQGEAFLLNNTLEEVRGIINKARRDREFLLFAGFNNPNVKNTIHNARTTKESHIEL